MTMHATSHEDGTPLEAGFIEGTLGFNLRIAQLRVIDDLIGRLARVKLRPAEFAVLGLIADNPGCRASQIAEYLLIARPNFVPLLARLEKRGLVVRRQSDADRRFHDLFLTKMGTRALAKAKAAIADQEAYLAGHLGIKQHAEMVKTLRSLARIDFSA